ncbi:hypothetical protein N9M58_01045 [Amylibacter sp.]|nr:hypothetical protein [Amylibacter sp.]MDA8756527.1 hypothetical protein [Amylibacter sp.]
MCKPGKYIRLCTCAADQIIEDRCWYLRKLDPDPQIFAIGLITYIEPEDPASLQSYLEEKILSDINNTKVFDFEYSPQDGDLLDLNYDEFVFSYKAIDGKFVQAEQDYEIKQTIDVAEGNISFSTK